MPSLATLTNIVLEVLAEQSRKEGREGWREEGREKKRRANWKEVKLTIYR